MTNDAPKPPPLGAGKRVLLAMERKEQGASCSALLRHAGFEIDEAGGGADCWQALRGKRYDLVIADHGGPESCGLALIRQMREAGMRQPAILISNDRHMGRETEDPGKGPTVVIPKTYSAYQLLNAVDALLDPASPPIFDDRPAVP